MKSMRYKMQDTGSRMRDEKTIMHRASCILHRSFCLALLLCAATVAGSAAEVGSPVEAAPQVAGSRIQMWPAAAWSEGAKCWLVA